MIHIAFVGHCRYGTDLAKQLTGSLHSVLPSCGSVRVSFSRRTPQKVVSLSSIIPVCMWLLSLFLISNVHVYCRQVSDIILRELGDQPNVYVWDGKGDSHLYNRMYCSFWNIWKLNLTLCGKLFRTKPTYGSPGMGWCFCHYCWFS